MIAVDTNVFVYAHREDSTHHETARAVLAGLASGPAPWATPLQCLVEFVGITTHPRIYTPPSPLAKALDAVDTLLRVPSLRVLTETSDDWSIFGAALRHARARGPRVHDVRIAAICRDHGISEIVTADRRFPRVPGLTVRDILA